MSEDTPKSEEAVLRRRDFFPIGQYCGRAVFVGVENGTPYLLSAERSLSGFHAASVGTWAGTFVPSPALSSVASAFLSGEPVLGTLFLVVGLAAFPVAVVIRFGAVRRSLEFERSEIETRALLDLLVRSHSQGQTLALFASAHPVLFTVLAVFVASMAWVDHLIGATSALGLTPVSIYAACAVRHYRQWSRRWSQTLRSTQSTPLRRTDASVSTLRPLLPLDSVVVFHNDDVRLMIIGRVSLYRDESIFGYFDYMAMKYPVGLTEDSVAYFNAEDITEVLSEGFADEEDKAIQAVYTSAPVSDGIPYQRLNTADTRP